mgnify:CR=1 FL=1
MKKVLLYTIFIIILLLSISVVAYPFVSNYLNSLNSDSAVMQYLSISGDTQKDFSKVLESAYEYNKELAKTTCVVSDPFSVSEKENADYTSQLSVDNTDVMATIEIKAINVNLPIYHGTSEDVLTKGIGHLSSSSLPVGGIGTHSVITGHTGYSAMRLFSDLDKLAVGDVAEMKKKHPCGGEQFAVLRIGADFRIRCVNCGREVMLERVKVEKNIKKIIREE